MSESKKLDEKRAIELLNKILEMELAGVVRYTHYSLMVFGHARIPITEWLRSEASTSLEHAHQAGELITDLGHHPSLGIGRLLETHQHNIDDILRESLEHERETLGVYRQLLDVVADSSVMLEEYARRMIETEERHVGEVDKMLRKPGTIETVR